MEEKTCRICSLGKTKRGTWSLEVLTPHWRSDSVFATKDAQGIVCLYSTMDNDEFCDDEEDDLGTNCYYPKYCPECGRKLND